MKKYLLFFFGCVVIALTAIGITACNGNANNSGKDEPTTDSSLVGEWRCNDTYYGSVSLFFEKDGTGLIVESDGYDSDYEPFLYSYDANTKLLTLLYTGGYYGYESMEKETYYLQWFGTNKILVSEYDTYYHEVDEPWGLFIRQ